MAKRGFTALGIEAIGKRAKRLAKRLEVPDPGCTGLYVQAQPSGAIGYAVRYRFDGTPAKFTLQAGLGLAAARAAATEALRQVEQGIDPRASRRAAKAAAEVAAANTLRAVSEAHLHFEESRPAGKRLRTIWQRRATFERLIFDKLGGRPIAEIKRSEIVRLLDHVRAERGPRMADEVLSCLSIVFTWHARRADDFRSPIVRGMGISKPADRVRNRVLNNDELRRLWHAADEIPLFGPFVQFVLLTCTRRGEAADMRWSELLPNGDWLIPSHRYKNKFDHLVPLSRAAQEVLANIPKIGEFVFTFDGRRPLGDFHRFKQKLDARAGVTGYRLHDLRRTARTLLSAARVNADFAERCLGHALPGLRKTYDCFDYRAEKAEAFDLLARHIAGIVNPPEDNNVVALRA
jgi:integrase